MAIIAADAEFAQAAATGAREELKKHGMKVVFDKSYPPATTDFTPVMRAVQAANADIVYAGAYPPDSVGIVRAANEIGLNPKMFGGALIGQLVTPIKAQLGPTIALDDLLPAERTVCIDSGNFMGTQACSCPCQTSWASASRRRSSRSGSGWPVPSGHRSRSRTGSPSPRSGTAVR